MLGSIENPLLFSLLQEHLLLQLFRNLQVPFLLYYFLLLQLHSLKLAVFFVKVAPNGKEALAVIWRVVDGMLRELVLVEI